ncbi:MAG: LAGLIDADG family homing endonuclease [bacterium]|nr:LAGLIDADG family homing endonuclease [bacterium]
MTSVKSKTIKSVKVPRRYFPDFLRGLFDGDGTFYTFWDKRWPRSFSFKLSVASASLAFINWLKEKLSQYYGVKGYMHKGDGVYHLEYVKGDSKKLFRVMYYSKNVLCFSKKYNKMKTALKLDADLGLSFLQKQRKPR